MNRGGLPRRYLTSSSTWPTFMDMPQTKEIVLENTPEAKTAWRVAAMRYSAEVLRARGFSNAAVVLDVVSAALKHGVPDGCHAFADDEIEVVEITLGDLGDQP